MPPKLAPSKRQKRPSRAQVAAMHDFYERRRQAETKYYHGNAEAVAKRAHKAYVKDIVAKRERNRKYLQAWRDEHRKEYNEYQRKYYHNHVAALCKKKREYDRQVRGEMQAIRDALRPTR
jgi:hypothetical protein